VQKLTSGVIVLGAADGDACSFVVSVSKDWVEQGLNAGKIAREVAKVAGGGGGGGAENAQAGGRDSSKLPEALKKAAELLSLAR